jgi:hypothetical protein
MIRVKRLDPLAETQKMLASEWLRPPNRLLVLFLAVIVLPAGALAWLGWRLLEQDRALLNQRVQEHLERDATRVSAEVRRQIDGLRLELPFLIKPSAAAPDDGALVVRMRPDGVEAWPHQRLLYHPWLPMTSAAPVEAFAASEALEFRLRDLEGAAAAYADLTGRESPAAATGPRVEKGRTARGRACRLRRPGRRRRSRVGQRAGRSCGAAGAIDRPRRPGTKRRSGCGRSGAAGPACRATSSQPCRTGSALR